MYVTSDDGEYVVFVSRGLSDGGFFFSGGIVVVGVINRIGHV